MLGRLGAVGSITAYLDSWIDGQITVRRSRQDSSRLRARDEWRKLIIEGKVRYHCRPASLPHGMETWQLLLLLQSRLLFGSEASRAGGGDADDDALEDRQKAES